jgi:hypothetical protein
LKLLLLGTIRVAKDADHRSFRHAYSGRPIPDVSEICLVHTQDYQHRRIRQIFLLDARKHYDWIARRICIGAMSSNRRHVLPLCLSSRKTPTAPKHSPNTVGQQ